MKARLLTVLILFASSLAATRSQDVKVTNSFEFSGKLFSFLTVSFLPFLHTFRVVQG